MPGTRDRNVDVVVAEALARDVAGPHRRADAGGPEIDRGGRRASRRLPP